jgi:hypothetical protein
LNQSHEGTEADTGAGTRQLSTQRRPALQHGCLTLAVTRDGSQCQARATLKGVWGSQELGTGDFADHLVRSNVFYQDTSSI